MTSKVAIIGCGNFGLALAEVFTNNKIPVSLWSRDPLKKHETLKISSHLEQVLDNARLVIFSLPSSAFYQTVQQVFHLIPPTAYCVSATKGLEPIHKIRMSEILLQKIKSDRVGVLSGPNLATEIIQRKITGTVIASENESLCYYVQQQLACKYLRVYSTSDTTGVEWAGLLKNIYAILYGIASQLNLGANAKGILLSRSLAEMCRFGVAMGAKIETFMGLAGMGDLITTCSSTLSRNYQMGVCIAQGLTLQQSLSQIGETVEGINTVNVVTQLNKQTNVSIPLASELFDVLYNGVSTTVALENLMSREQTTDIL